MDDRDSHFFTLVGKLCDEASVGGIPVRLVLQDGTSCEGHPRPRVPEEGGHLDDTGYGNAIDLDTRTVKLSDVVQASVLRP